MSIFSILSIIKYDKYLRTHIKNIIIHSAPEDKDHLEDLGTGWTMLKRILKKYDGKM
jgi:hypothetical protein